MGAIRQVLGAVRRRLAPRPAPAPNAQAAPAITLQEIKTSLIDRASEHGLTSFADLGGVWAVEAGYTFYTLDNHRITRAALVDTGITNTVAAKAKAKGYPQLELINENFGDRAAVERVGSVDAVFLFDVLLHQVNPDWDQILEMYAPTTRMFAIVNPQYTRGTQTVRLIDLGREGYTETVPVVGVHDEAWDKLDEIHPKYGRPYRDVHEIWQWGIVDADLDRKLTSLGFRCVFDENRGPWHGLPAFDNRAFLYVRDA